jgi:hypothetical protein
MKQTEKYIKNFKKRMIGSQSHYLGRYIFEYKTMDKIEELEPHEDKNKYFDILIKYYSKKIVECFESFEKEKESMISELYHSRGNVYFDKKQYSLA